MKNLLLFLFICANLFLRSQVPPVCFNALVSANISSVGITPREVCSVDVNGDGKPDLITANESANNVSVLLGSGTGTFASPVNYNVGTAPRSVTSADFNNDGYPDLATANLSTNDVSVLFGSATGTFAAAINYGVGTYPQCVRSGDFNLDGYNDLVSANFSSNDVSILLGSASGTFASAVSYMVGSIPVSICIADFNNDGNADLAVANSYSNNVSLLRGSLSGTFASAVNFTTGMSPYDVSSADFNGDGNMDITVSNYGANNLTVLMGTGTGSFSSQTNYSTAGSPVPNAIGDYNGDGNLDIAIGNYVGNSISLLLGNSTGSFTPAGTYQLMDQPISLIASDFNSDGISDLAASCLLSGKVTVLINNGSNTLGSSLVYPTGNFPNSVQAADFNSDGHTDLVVSNNSSNTMSILLGQGTGLFSPPVNYAVSSGPGNAVIADFNNDTHPDVALTISTTSVAILLGSATGTFGSPTAFAFGWSPQAMTYSDFNLDGNIDLAAVNLLDQTVSVLLGLGTGSFAAVANYTVGESNGIAAGDLNGDSYPDLAIPLRLYANILVLLGSSSGTFTSGGNFALASNPYDVKIADINGDMINDILATTGASVSLLVGLGSGSFATQTSFPVGNSPLSITTGDYNLDGIMDIASANYAAGNLSVLLGVGSSSFAPQVLYATGSSPRGIISADLNADTKTDLVVVNGGSSSAQILLNAQPTLSLTAANSVCLGNSLVLNATGAGTYTWSTGATTHSISITPNSISTYTVIGKSFGGCLATAMKTITVNALPLPTITANSGTVCLAKNFTLSPSGADTYTFTGGHAIVHPYTNTTYTITGTNTLTGCVSLPVVANVSVIALPAVNVSSGTICAGQTFTLNPSGAFSYTFSGGSANVSPAATTSYSVSGTSSVGCVSSSPAIATITVNTLPLIAINSGSICAGESFTLIPSGAVSYTYSSGNAIVTPVSTTTFAVAGTNSLGCVSATNAISQVTVHALPLITVNSGSICAGESFTLTPSGASTYTYSSGPIVAPLSTSSYTIIGTNSFGCISASAAVSTVTVNALPTFSISGNNSVCEGSSLSQIASGSALTYSWSNGLTGNFVTLNPTVSATYTITGFDNNCFFSITKYIAVNPLPLISVNGGSVCSGESFTFNATGAISYIYPGGSPIISPVATNAYTIIGVDTNGCDGTAITTINVLPLPTVGAIPGGYDTICAGETLTIFAVGATTYSWSTGEFGSSIVVTPTLVTTYTVTGSDQNGCMNSGTRQVNVEQCLSIKELNSVLMSLTIYPNPNSGEFIIDSKEPLSVVIVNAIGQFISEQKVVEGKNKIDLGAYENGVYFVQFRKNAGVQTLKVIKN